MLQHAKLVAFVATTDRTRARAFYEGVLGLTIVHDDGFALVADTGGTQLRIAQVERLVAAQYTVLGWDVTDIRAVVADLAARGIAFKRYEGMGQDELGVWTSPSGARVAWFEDPDGNVLSVSEH